MLKPLIHKTVFIHESSFIDSNVKIAKNVKIWHFCHILENVEIGANSSFGQNCVIGPNIKIGSGVKVQNNVSIFEGVEVEDDVFIGPSVVFSNVINPRAFINRKSEYKKTFLKKGCSLGAGVVVVCGSSIGQYALIGAGCLIKGEVKAHALMVGNPMRQIGWVDKSGIKLNFKDNYAWSENDQCGYILKNNKLKEDKTNLND